MALGLEQAVKQSPQRSHGPTIWWQWEDAWAVVFAKEKPAPKDRDGAGRSSKARNLGRLFDEASRLRRNGLQFRSLLEARLFVNTLHSNPRYYKLNSLLAVQRCYLALTLLAAITCNFEPLLRPGFSYARFMTCSAIDGSFDPGGRTLGSLTERQCCNGLQLCALVEAGLLINTLHKIPPY
jgi:hypothetical protein